MRDWLLMHSSFPILLLLLVVFWEDMARPTVFVVAVRW